MKALTIFLLMVLSLSTSTAFAQYPFFYEDRNDIEIDTTRARILLGFGGTFGGNQKTLGSPLKKTLNTGSEGTFLRPEMDYLWHLRFQHPKLRQSVLDFSYEGIFSVNKITSLGGVYFGRKNILFGGVAGVVVQKVSGGKNYVRSEIGRYMTENIFGFRQISNFEFAESSTTFLFSGKQVYSEYVFLFKHHSLRVNYYAGGVLSKRLSFRLALTTKSGLFLTLDSSLNKDLRVFIARTF